MTRLAVRLANCPRPRQTEGRAVKEFRTLLVRTYSSSLAHPRQAIEVKPSKVGAQDRTRW